MHPWHGNQSLAGEAQNGTTRAALPRDARAWKVSRKDIEKALRCSGNSSPGPDGISFAIWRACKGLASSILLDVANELEEDHAERDMIDAYADESAEGEHDFNLSTLVCLPKTPTGEDVELGVYHAPADTRPLSIVNCDNRLAGAQ